MPSWEINSTYEAFSQPGLKNLSGLRQDYSIYCPVAQAGPDPLGMGLGKDSLAGKSGGDHRSHSFHQGQQQIRGMGGAQSQVEERLLRPRQHGQSGLDIGRIGATINDAAAKDQAMVGGEAEIIHHELGVRNRHVAGQQGQPLRQPLETGKVDVARANAHVSFPANVQLVAAMNPCRCGHLGDAALACSRAPRCAADYQSKVSGPMLDRIDLHVEVDPVSAADLALPPPAEGSAQVAARVSQARERQTARLDATKARTNADLEGDALERFATPDEAGRQLLMQAATAMRLSARSYTRMLRVARTIADLAGAEEVGRIHVAEALSYRRQAPRA